MCIILSDIIIITFLVLVSLRDRIVLFVSYELHPMTNSAYKSVSVYPDILVILSIIFYISLIIAEKWRQRIYTEVFISGLLVRFVEMDIATKFRQHRKS